MEGSSGIEAAAKGREESFDVYSKEFKDYERLERDFQEVLQELVGDKNLERFRVEYERIHRAFKKAYDNEKRLAKRCHELNAEIVSNAAKVQTALRLSDQDQNTISSLKKEIEKAWKMVDASHEKEEHAKERVEELKMEIINLTHLVEQRSGLETGEEEMVNELLRRKDELIKERDSQIDQIVHVRNQAMELQEKLKSVEGEKEGLEAALLAVKGKIDEMNTDTEREARKKERMEKEMKEIKETLQAKQMELSQKQAQVDQSEETIARLEQMNRDSRRATDKINKEFNQLNEQVQKLQHDLEEQIHTNTQLLAENSQKQVELKTKDDDFGQMKSELTKVLRIRDQVLKKLKTVESQKVEVEAQREKMRLEISEMEGEIEAAWRQLEMEKKKQDDMLRERDILNKLKTQAEGATEQQLDLIRINESTKKHLEHEIQGYKQEALKQTKIIYQLEQEREKSLTEANNAHAKYTEVMEEVAMRETEIEELQKRIDSVEGRLRQQQNLYESVRTDRNKYSKSLIESQDEVQELKRRFKIMSHQMEQLKEEINSKDMSLVKEHFELMNVEKEKRNLKSEVDKYKKLIEETENSILEQKTEILKLNDMIKDADQEKVRQQREHDAVASERDILGTQLIRRNEELALLYDKLKTQQSVLSKGHVQYRDRCNEIRVLKIKINDLRRELHILKTSTANVEIMKNEIHSLGKELMQEKTKVKALGEELENPLNVHRWRRLEGSDPMTFELLQKIQALQKRLISKTEEVVERDLMIQEKDKLYAELKNILSRQPGAEVAEQLGCYKATLRKKTKKLQAMVAELNMHQAQATDYKFEISRLLSELTDVKKKYFQKKKLEKIEKDNGKAEGAAKPKEDKDSQPKFTGGGFSISTHTTDPISES